MRPSDVALAGLEQALNRYVALDPGAAPRLARDHGRVIRLHLRGPDLELFLVPQADGRLQLLRRLDGEPDCSLSGSPLDLVRSGGAGQGARQLFSGRIALSGDTELAQRFGNTLAGLDIDWEEQLARLTGDVIAHQAGHRARQGRDHVRRLAATFGDNLGEYLTEEKRLLPARHEVEDHFAEIERLRDDVERAAARLDRLARRAAERGRRGDGDPA